MAGGSGWEAAGAPRCPCPAGFELQVFQAISSGSIRQRAEVALCILFLIFPPPGLCWNIKHSIQLSWWALWGSPSSRVIFPKRGLLLQKA